MLCHQTGVSFSLGFPLTCDKVWGTTSQEGVQEVGVLLLHGGDDPASPAGQRLTALMSAYSQVGVTHSSLLAMTGSCAPADCRVSCA